MPEPIPTIPVRDDIRFQNTIWFFERVGWALLALVPFAALTGLFSHGPLSDRTVTASNSAFTMEYERFQRVTVQSRFVFRMPSTGEDEVRLRLSPSFQEHYDIQSMTPAPAHAGASSDGLEFYFTPTGGEVTTVIRAKPRDWGRIEINAENDTGTIQVPVLIYP